MPTTPRLSDWLSLLALSVMWGTAFMFNELALAAFSPAAVVAGRVVVGLAVLAVAFRLSGVAWLPRRGEWGPLVILALLGVVAPLHLTAWAQLHIDSGVTAILMSIMPLFVLTLAHFFVPGERLTAVRVAGFCVGFAGVALIVGPQFGALDGNRLELWGMLAALAAALSYSINAVYARRLALARPASAPMGVTIIAAFLTVPAVLFEAPVLQAPPVASAIIALLVLGSLCTGAASVLYFRIVRGPGPSFLSLVNYLIPAWAVIAGATVLGEPLTIGVLAGMTLMLGGIALSEFGGRLLRRAALTRLRANTRVSATYTA